MLDSIWNFLVVMICSNHYISNRYLVAKLIEVLFLVNPRVQPMFQKINDNLLQNPIAFDHLVPALMQFYSGGCTLAFSTLPAVGSDVGSFLLKDGPVV